MFRHLLLFVYITENQTEVRYPLGGSLQQANLITVKTKYYKRKLLHVKNKVESVSLQVGMPTDDLGQTHCNLIEKYMISFFSEYLTFSLYKPLHFRPICNMACCHT